MAHSFFVSKSLGTRAVVQFLFYGSPPEWPSEGDSSDKFLHEIVSISDTFTFTYADEDTVARLYELAICSASFTSFEWDPVGYPQFPIAVEDYKEFVVESVSDKNYNFRITADIYGSNKNTEYIPLVDGFTWTPNKLLIFNPDYVVVPPNSEYTPCDPFQKIYILSPQSISQVVIGSEPYYEMVFSLSGLAPKNALGIFMSSVFCGCIRSDLYPSYYEEYHRRGWWWLYGYIGASPDSFLSLTPNQGTVLDDFRCLGTIKFIPKTSLSKFYVYSPTRHDLTTLYIMHRLVIREPRWLVGKSDIEILTSPTIQTSGEVLFGSQYEFIVYERFSLLGLPPVRPRACLIPSDSLYQVQDLSYDSLLSVKSRGNSVRAINMEDTVDRIRPLFGIKRLPSTVNFRLSDSSWIVNYTYDESMWADSLVVSDKCYMIRKMEPSSFWIWVDDNLKNAFDIQVEGFHWYVGKSGIPSCDINHIDDPNIRVYINPKYYRKFVPPFKIRYYDIYNNILKKPNSLPITRGILPSRVPSRLVVKDYIGGNHKASEVWSDFMNEDSYEYDHGYDFGDIPLDVHTGSYKEGRYYMSCFSVGAKVPSLENYLRYPECILSDRLVIEDSLEKEKCYLSEKILISEYNSGEFSGVYKFNPSQPYYYFSFLKRLPYASYREYPESKWQIAHRSPVEHTVETLDEDLTHKEYFIFTVDPKEYWREGIILAKASKGFRLELPEASKEVGGNIIYLQPVSYLCAYMIPLNPSEDIADARKRKIHPIYSLYDSTLPHTNIPWWRFFYNYYEPPFGIVKVPIPPKLSKFCLAVFWDCPDNILEFWDLVGEDYLEVVNDPYTLYFVGEQLSESLQFEDSITRRWGYSHVVKVSDGFLAFKKLSKGSDVSGNIRVVSIGMPVGQIKPNMTLSQVLSRSMVTNVGDKTFLPDLAIPANRLGNISPTDLWNQGIVLKETYYTNLNVPSAVLTAKQTGLFVAKPSINIPRLRSSYLFFRDSVFTVPTGSLKNGYEKSLNGTWRSFRIPNDWDDPNIFSRALGWGNYPTTQTDNARLPLLIPFRSQTDPVRIFSIETELESGGITVYPYKTGILGNETQIVGWGLDNSSDFWALIELAAAKDVSYDLDVSLGDKTVIKDSFNDTELLHDVTMASEILGTGPYSVKLSEVVFSDYISSSGLLHSYRLLAEIGSLSEYLPSAMIYYYTLSNLINCIELLKLQLSLKLYDSLVVPEIMQPNGIYQWLENEVLIGVEYLSSHFVYSFQIDESLNIESIGTYTVSILRTLLESFVAKEGLTVNSVANLNLGVTMTGRDSVLAGLREKISEFLTATLSSPINYLLYLTLSANSTVTDTFGHVFGWVHKDVSTITGSVSQFVEITHILEDKGLLFPRIYINNETYDCWCFSMDLFKASIFTNYNFDSFTSIGSQTFATRSDGIYLLEGETDGGQGIQTGIRVDLGSLGSHLKKRFYRAYFGISSSGTPRLKAIADDHEVVYDIIEGRANIAVGQQGRRWVFELMEVDSMDFIELVPIILSR